MQILCEIVWKTAQVFKKFYKTSRKVCGNFKEFLNLILEKLQEIIDEI